MSSSSLTMLLGCPSMGTFVRPGVTGHSSKHRRHRRGWLVLHTLLGWKPRARLACRRG